jgi:hypothetical protein
MSVSGKSFLPLIFITLFIIGCVNQPKVHVYARYLSNVEIENISKEIEEFGLTPVINDLDFPATITSSSIIYSPLLRNSSNVDSLISAMNSIGISVSSVDPLVSGNHWYTRDSIALLVFNKESVSNGRIRTRDLANKYKSIGCEKFIQLELKENGRYQLISDTWINFDLSLSKGTWEYRQYPYIELRPEKGERWYRYYEIVEKVEEDKVGQIEMLKLVPLDTHQLAGDCHFVHGIRV